jgi:hypothetical protein
VEKASRTSGGEAAIDPAAAAAMSREDHRQGSADAMAALLAEFDAYRDRPGADPYADLVGYRQGVLWPGDDELVDAAGEIQSVLVARAGNQAGPGRRPRLVSLIRFPTEAPSAPAIVPP